MLSPKKLLNLVLCCCCYCLTHPGAKRTKAGFICSTMMQTYSCMHNHDRRISCPKSQWVEIPVFLYVCVYRARMHALLKIYLSDMKIKSAAISPHTLPLLVSTVSGQQYCSRGHTVSPLFLWHVPAPSSVSLSLNQAHIRNIHITGKPSLE